MEQKEVSFFWNGSFFDKVYFFVIDDKEYNMGFLLSDEDAQNEALGLIKSECGIDYPREQIKFKWGVSLAS